MSLRLSLNSADESTIQYIMESYGGYRSPQAVVSEALAVLLIDLQGRSKCPKHAVKKKEVDLLTALFE